MLKKFWRPETGIFLCFWLILMVGGQSRFFRDPGTFWHTTVGEQILATHKMIYVDTFTFTFTGQRWLAHQWLGECLMAWLYRFDQLDTLLLATVTILSGLYTWAAYRLIRGGLHWSLAGVLVAFTMAASSSHFHIRPHLGTIVFLGITLGFLIDFETGRIGVRRLFWLVPIFIIWTNDHGGMLGGLASLGLIVAGWTAFSVLRLPSPVQHFKDLVPLGFLILGCGLTSLVNPYGVQLPQVWLEIMDSSILPKIIKEHAPLDWHKPEGVMVLVFVAIYFFMLLGILPKCPRVTWLFPIVWFYLGWNRVRHTPLFSISAILAIADMLPHTRWRLVLVARGSDWFVPVPETPGPQKFRITLGPWLLPALVVLAAFILQLKQVVVPVIGHGWAKLDPAYWPVEMLPELKRYEHEAGKENRIFNEYLFGGYLIYATPGYKIFVDDRCELFGDQWLQEYVDGEARNTGQYMEKMQGKYGLFPLALTHTGSGFDQYLAASREWDLVKRSDTASFYRRKNFTP